MTQFVFTCKKYQHTNRVLRTNSRVLNVKADSCNHNFLKYLKYKNKT